MRCAAQPSLERHEHARATHESARRKGAAEGVAVRRPLAALLRAILSPGLLGWSPGEHCLLPLLASVGAASLQRAPPCAPPTRTGRASPTSENMMSTGWDLAVLPALHGGTLGSDNDADAAVDRNGAHCALPIPQFGPPQQYHACRLPEEHTLSKEF